MTRLVLLFALTFAGLQSFTYVDCCCAFCAEQGTMTMRSPGPPAGGDC